MNLLQIFQKTKGKGTTTDPNKRPFAYWHKLAEIDYEEMGEDVVKTVSRIAENFEPDELAFDNGGRLDYQNETLV